MSQVRSLSPLSAAPRPTADLAHPPPAPRPLLVNQPAPRTGFHARRLAERQQRLAGIDGKLGMHGLKTTEPLADRDALRDQVHPPAHADDSHAGAYESVGGTYRPPATVVNQDEIPGPQPGNGSFPIAEPLDRHPHGPMRPHLKLMCVPSLSLALFEAKAGIGESLRPWDRWREETGFARDES